MKCILTGLSCFNFHIVVILVQNFQTVANDRDSLVSSTQSFIPKSLDQVEDYERDQERIKSGKDTEGIYYQTITGLKDLSGVRLSADQTQDAKDLATNGVFSDDEDDDDDDDEDLNEDFHEHVKIDDAKDLATRRIQNGAEDVDRASKDIARPAEDQTPDAKDLATSAGQDGDEDDDGASENSEDEDSSDDEGEANGAPRDPRKEAARLARKEHKKKVKAEKREARKTKLPKALKKKKKKLAKSKCTR